MTNKNFSTSQIKSWGMFYKFRFESFKDEVLKNITNPSDDQKKEIIKLWLNDNKITNEKVLYSWLKLNKMSEKEWRIYTRY